MSRRLHNGRLRRLPNRRVLDRDRRRVWGRLDRLAAAFAALAEQLDRVVSSAFGDGGYEHSGSYMREIAEHVRVMRRRVEERVERV